MMMAEPATTGAKLRAGKIAAVGLLLGTLVAGAGGSARAGVARGPHQGGTINVTWGTPLTTMDPAFTYGATDWPQTHLVFDGLLGFKNGITLQPDMAAALPTVSKDGLTYTFHLRKGIVFSNGDPITAGDFVYSWERVLAPKTASPDTYLWTGVKGAAEFEAGKAQHVSGFSAPDDNTVTVTVAQPFPAIQYVLATPSSMVVDPKVVAQLGAQHKDMGSHVVGSGPYMLTDWVQGQKADFARNPHYFLAGLPYADKVHMDLGVAPSTALLRLYKGQVDLIGDGIPSAQFASVITNDKLKPQIASLTDIGVYMISMNTKLKPFTDIRVRQAVSYAISKVRAIRFINGRGTPANGILPKTLPGFGRDIPEQYPYNPAKAKQLLAQAGFPNGFTTTMGVPSGGVYEQRMADAAIYDLKQVGITVNVKPTVNEGSAVATIPMQAYHWLLDYPDPADFVDGFTSCAGAMPGGSNVAFYCNPTVDKLANAARGMPYGPARVNAYLNIDTLIMKDAMSVPVFNDIYYYIHSTRLQNYTIPLMWAPFALEQYWVQ